MKTQRLILCLLFSIPLSLFGQMSPNIRTEKINEAKRNITQSNYKQAILVLTEVVKADINDQEANKLIDICEICMGFKNQATRSMAAQDYNQAIERFNNILKYNPYDSEVPKLIEECQRLQYTPKLEEAKQLYEKGQYNRAESVLNEYIRKTGKTDSQLVSAIKTAIELSTSAKNAYDSGDYASARQYYEKLLKFNPTDAISSQAIAEINNRFQRDNQKPLGKKYNVGDYYTDNDGNYGVVFWVDETKEHVKIVSLDEVEKCIWSYRDEKTNALSNADGYYNTEMIKKIKKWEKNYPAFYWCTSHGPGWYLPAKNELLQLYYSLPKVNLTLRNYGKEIGNHEYWSSTDIESIMCTRAIQIIFYKHEPMIHNGDKDLRYSPHVRAIRKF